MPKPDSQLSQNLLAEELAVLRARVDKLDMQVVEILSARFRLTREVGQLKAKYQLPAVDPVREAAQFEAVAAKAEALKVSPKLARRFLRLVIDETVASHRAIVAGQAPAKPTVRIDPKAKKRHNR